MSNGIKLVILIEVKAGQAAQQIALYNKVKPLVLAEAGCLQYEMNRITGSDVQFVLIESWTSQDALTLHDQTLHMKEADALSLSFRVGPAKVIQLSRL
ncbi:antibiotic biosynthesis monooxygenase family protein [Psychromonas sp. SP041]|uniref:putative quinol monooxygenase n=1 Tax=Psychromonas sp. SP041 TaxID=1365007 RepID=UPI000427BF9D|nr:antibiotic biosynthesis monooxygenase family protein [Psychromonas sp. SP041]